MSGLITFLLFAVLFYLMMRMGCGAHMVHGRHGHGGGHPPGGTSATDPVCGMSVDPAEGYVRRYAGHEYPFCSRNCLDQFDADPERYAHPAGGSS